jgi:RNA polymerase sigma-70 factor (sigma-E family)
MRSSDTDAEFTAFAAARGPALLRTAYLLTGDHQAAEDLVQTALAKTYVAWSRIRDREAVEAYVRRTMVTTQTSWWRRRWRGETPTAELPDAVPAPGADAAGGDMAGVHAERDRIWRHLGRLSERQRTVVVLRFYEDLGEAEIAALLGCSPGAVKSHTHRALTRLRQLLADEGLEADVEGEVRR